MFTRQYLYPALLFASLEPRIIHYQLQTKRRQANSTFPSLGCVLLELGLWQSLDTFHKGSYSADKFRDVLKSTTQELIGQTGSKYASATKACLNITSGINERQTQDLLFRSVLAVLEDCSA